MAFLGGVAFALRFPSSHPIQSVEVPIIGDDFSATGGAQVHGVVGIYKVDVLATKEDEGLSNHRLVGNCQALRPDEDAEFLNHQRFGHFEMREERPDQFGNYYVGGEKRHLASYCRSKKRAAAFVLSRIVSEEIA